MSESGAGAVVVGPVGQEQLPLCRKIRRDVFMRDQGVPEELELDGLDDEAIHFLAWQAGQPVGTARMRVLGRQAKAERVAVLPAFAGHGLGRRLMGALERQAVASGLEGVVLNSQESAIPFYQKLGYAGVGEVFLEAGIRHRTMSKALSPG